MSREQAERRGRRSEALAAWYLRLKGWRILARRVKTPRGEVDLVARRGRMVAFVEVKWRRTAAELDIAIDHHRLRRVAAAAEAIAGRLPKARRPTLMTLRAPSTGVVIDEALVLRFDGPASATGENVVEYQCHGGRAVVEALLAAGDEAALVGHIDGIMQATGYSTNASRSPSEIARRLKEKRVLSATELKPAQLDALREFLSLSVSLKYAPGVLGTFAGRAGLKLDEAVNRFDARVAVGADGRGDGRGKAMLGARCGHGNPQAPQAGFYGKCRRKPHVGRGRYAPLPCQFPRVNDSETFERHGGEECYGNAASSVSRLCQSRHWRIKLHRFGANARIAPHGIVAFPRRRGGRAVDCTGLENRQG